MFDSAFPIISTPNVPRSLSFYRDLLGGVVAYQFLLTVMRSTWASISAPRTWGSVTTRTSATTAPPGVFSIWVYASDCDAAVEMLRSAGTPVHEEPVDQPWGERVARVGDPDGNVIIIGSRPEGVPGED